MADLRPGLSRGRVFRTLRRILAGAVLAAWAVLPAVRAIGPGSPLPAVRVDRLENGLTLVSVPLRDSGVVVLATIVRAGSRHEAEPGTGGFAHLIAHLADRGPLRSPRGYAPDLLARLGARVEGIVSDDASIRTVVFSGPENLGDVVRVEADRIINLEIEAGAVRREAAVLEVEAGAPAGSPDVRLDDELRRTAFLSHPYGRPARGTRDDFRTLAERSEAAQLFGKRAYAPDNVVLLAAGDISPQRLLDLVGRAYAGWGKSGYAFEAPLEPMPESPRRSRVSWPAPTLARLAMGFRIPAYSDREPDKAALDLLAAAAFSASSPLYDRLVRREKACLALRAAAPERRDPYLFLVSAEAESEAALALIEKAVLEEIERLKSDLIPARALDAARSGRLGALRLTMETTEGAAAALAGAISLTGDPGSLTRLGDLYGRIGPLEVREAVRRHLKPSTVAIVTLAAGPPPAPPEAAAKGPGKAGPGAEALK